MTDSLTKINWRTFYRANVVVFLTKVQVHINFSALCAYIVLTHFRRFHTTEASEY